ncbi:MAG: ParB/RepB/Spo0J family partition protein [candidate division Zixibacteria bacterium]|nr:ParB/RepB/Spo0J family partition protein [candidate division Zixibacteria bacterium]
MNKVKLGRGLNALIPNDIDVSEKKKFIVVDTEKITPNPDQPRREFDESSLKNLADSITQNGILQPLLLKAVNGNFQLVAGERRFRAAQMIGLERVPAILVEGLSRLEQMQLALIENLQREDLNVMELAEGYSRMINEYGLTQDELSQKVSKNRSTITNTLRLLNLPAEVKDLIREGKISSGHARTILALSSEKEQLEVAGKIIDENLSVRVLEDLIYGKKRRKRGKSLKLKKMPTELIDAETNLKQYLGTKVNLKRGLKKGKIEIEFYSDSDLTRILDLILEG